VLIFFFGVVGDSWRVVGDVGGHDSFGAVHREERREASRPVGCCANAPEHGGEFFCLASGRTL
jgi:hypothetical protein